VNTRYFRQSARRVTTIVIGGGHAGLAISHYLSALSVDHVVLERGEMANSWRRERWDSLRLLTPNWQNGLPGQCYRGTDPDGYMGMAEVVEFIEAYARRSKAPLHTQTTVTAVSPSEGGYKVATNRGEWHCRTLVIATGAFATPVVPAIAQAFPGSIMQLTPHQYRNPDQLAAGGVLVVGAAASGSQIAEEIQHSGRQVTLAVGEHVRMPRSYRGRDIQYWMHHLDLLDESIEDVDDIDRVRGLSSPQLIGTPEKRDLNLNTLSDMGVKLVGRVAGVQGSRLQFSASLANVSRLADLKMLRLLDAIDEAIEQRGLEADKRPPQRPERGRIERSPPLSLNLANSEIKTVLWATGFRPDYSWLEVPVLDRKGRLRHRGGVVASPGLYVMGLPFMRRRSSSFICGADNDARAITEHLVAYLTGSSARRRVA
jgi:putative flavoprotein involved in K+ transport